MTPAETEVTRVLRAIYASAVQPDSWPAALRLMAEVLDSDAAGMVVEERRSGTYVLACADPNAPLEALDEYTRYFGRIDETRRVVRQYAAGHVVTESAVLSTAIRDGECYNDFYRRWNLEHFIGTYPLNDAEYEATLFVYRRRNKGNHTTEQISLMECLAEHLVQAFDVWRHLRRAENKSARLEGAFDVFACGVVLVDRFGRVCGINASARDIMSLADGIGLVNQQLIIRDPIAAGLLRRCIQTVTSPAALGRRPQPFIVPRRSGARPYEIAAAPIEGPDSSVGVLVISDPERRPHSLQDDLRQAYTLTPAEAKLAATLITPGVTLETYADENRITPETARGYLKSTLRKTDTHGQAELVKLILRGSRFVLR